MASHSLNVDTKALTFDIFGTCVDWRSPVTKQLVAACQKAVNTPPSSPAKSKARHLAQDDWAGIAAEWRMTYYKFTRELANNPNAKFKTVDEHHHDALIDILAAHGLEGLWDQAELHHLAFAWHRLDSWPDTNEGLRILGKHFSTCTLSNGNIKLLEDMQKHSGMVFSHTFSGEMFGTYKPNPKVYLGAAEKLGIRPDQVTMVAAHLGDLEAAKGCGLQTIFVERPEEESGDLEQAKRKGYIDLWVGPGDGGFLGIAKSLGLS